VSDFDQALLRLKERLGIASDKGVAELLGMGEKALNARKRRGAFPAEKLKALALDKPELGIDVKYVLTGISDELERRMAAIRASTQIAMLVPDPAARPAIQQSSFDAIIKALAEDEQRLVSLYRQTDDRGKASLLASASALAMQMPPATKKSRKKS